MPGLGIPAEPLFRSKGFTIFYIGINVGAFLSSLIVGYVGEVHGWHYGFGLAGIGMALGLLQYLEQTGKKLPYLEKVVVGGAAVDGVVAAITLDVIITTDIGTRDRRSQSHQRRTFQATIAVQGVIAELAEDLVLTRAAGDVVVAPDADRRIISLLPTYLMISTRRARTTRSSSTCSPASGTTWLSSWPMSSSLHRSSSSRPRVPRWG